MYGVPSYDTIVLDEEDHGLSEWIGGETEALRRLQVLEKEVSVRNIFNVDVVVKVHPCFQCSSNNNIPKNIRK